MKLALVSDIHSHRVALEAVLREIDKEGVDGILCLGDIVDVGPEPMETIAILRDRGVRCIRGNHDTLSEHPTLPFLAALERWTEEQLGEEERSWLLGLPEERVVELGSTTLWCVHGSPCSADDQLLDSTPEALLREWIGERELDVLACGHTHIQLLRRLDERWIVNVGSTGQPFLHAHEGFGAPVILPWFEYAVIQAGRGPGDASVSLRRVPADREEVARAVKQSGMPHPEAWLSQWRW